MILASMSIIYRSNRIGKGGKPFVMFKIRTLRDDFSGSFANEDGYTKFGKFLRKTKLDELPQIYNIIKGDMGFIGPRPEESKTIDLLPIEIRDIILKVKPGLVDLASLFFYDEEEILQKSPDPQFTFWTQIRPTKMTLQAFYVENKCLSLDLWIIYATVKKIVKSLFLR